MPMVQWLVPAAWLWVLCRLVAWLSAGGLIAVGCTFVAFAFLGASCQSSTESPAINMLFLFTLQ